MKHPRAVATLAALLLLTCASAQAQTPCGTWRHSPTPSPNDLFSHFFGVAAVAPNDVWAVGEYDSLAGTYTPAIRAITAHWNGSDWTMVPTPAVGVTGTTLTGVAATGANDVWAIGFSNSYGTPQTLVQRWNGTMWSVVSSPAFGGGSSLDAIAAISANDLWAVGTRDGAGLNTTVATLAVHWNGSAWSAVPTPNVGNRWNALEAVAGSSANDVWAVGSWRHISGLYQNFAVHWNGTQWSIVPTPNVANAENQLQAVVAIAPDDAWALGSTNDGISGKAVYLHWNGTAWSYVAGPGDGTTLAGGDALVALASDDVWAIGSTLSHWDGSSWTLAPNPAVPGALGLALKSAVKVGPCDLWAVGSSFDWDTQRTVAVHLTAGGGTINLPPVAVANASVVHGLAPLTVELSAAASHDPDGSIVSYLWNFGDSTYPPERFEANPVHTYIQTGPLTYHAELQVIDDRGAIARTSVEIHIDTPVHVESQAVQRVRTKGQTTGQNLAQIVDASSRPIAGATVRANYAGPTSGTVSGVTGADGTVTLSTQPTGSATSEWCFTVTDVTGSELGYVASANVVTTRCESSVLDVPDPAAASSLELRVPNPCTRSATMRLVLPAGANISLRVVDAAGRLVRELRHEWLPAGTQEIPWDGADMNGRPVPSGLFFVRLVANGETRSARLLLLR